MIFVNGTSIYTVNTQQFELILTVEGDEVVMDETFLWKFVLVADSIEIQTGAEVFFSTLKTLYIFCVILLQEDGGFGGGALVSHAVVGIGGVGERTSFFAAGHSLSI